MKKIFKILSIFILFSCVLYTNIYGGIGIDPTQVEILVEPNAKYEGVWKVVNTGSKTASFKIIFENWFQKEIAPEKWLSIEEKEFRLDAGQGRELKFIVSIPKEASGEISAMVFFNTLEEGATIGAGFGIPVYVAIKGTEIIEAEITEFKVDYNGDKGISGFVNIRNKGNVHIRPYTTVQLLNNEGKSVAYFSIQYGLPIQPGRERKFNFTKEDIKLEPGRYKVIAQTEYGSLYNIDKRAIKKYKLIIGNIAESIKLKES